MVRRGDDRIHRIIHGKGSIYGYRQSFICLIAASQRMDTVDVCPDIPLSGRLVISLLLRRRKKCGNAVGPMGFIQKPVNPFNSLGKRHSVSKAGNQCRYRPCRIVGDRSRVGKSRRPYAGIKSCLTVAGIKEPDRYHSCQRAAAFAFIYLIFRCPHRFPGKRIQKTFFRFTAGMHEFFPHKADLPFMRLPSHPCALPAPRFLPRLAVKPAHIAAVQPFCFFQFLCICPQKSVYRGQFHLRISRHRRQISALPVPHKRTQAKGPVLVLNTTDRKLLQRVPQSISAGAANHRAAEHFYLRHLSSLNPAKPDSK